MNCPRCKDLGWVEEPCYSDFEPTTRPVACPDCSSHVYRTGPSTLDWLIIALFVLVMGVWVFR